MTERDETHTLFDSQATDAEHIAHLQAQIRALQAENKTLSKRLRNDSKLLSSAESFRLSEFFDISYDMMAISSPDGYFVRVNEAFSDTLGFNLRDLTSTPLVEFVHPADQKDTKKAFEILLGKRQRIYHFINRFQTKLGRYRWLEWNAAPGNDGFVYSVARDITDRLEADRRLVARERLYRSILHQLPGIIILLYDHDLRFILARGQGLDTIGLGDTPIEGKVLAEVAHPDWQTRLTEYYRRALTGKHVSFEASFADRDLQTQIVPIYDDSQNVIYGLVLSTDVTNLKRIQREKQHTIKELQQLNRELQQFASIISHDMRTPILNIGGFQVELMRNIDVLQQAALAGMAHLSEAEQRAVHEAIEIEIPEATEFIAISLQRLTRFNNAVLDYARLGTRSFNMESVPLEEVVSTTLDNLAHAIAKTHVEIETTALPIVWADRLSMEQIFANLIGNAIKYLEPSRPGQISIWGETGKNGSVTIHVRDNGRGIAEKNLPIVFQIFRRVGRQNTEGEGVGLAYVQAMVRRHNGYIGVESEEGVGSTFSFTIPPQEESNYSDTSKRPTTT